MSHLYGGNKVAVADGIDQLVRGAATRWKRTLPAGAPTEQKSLDECLRLKRNLGVFANAVAERSGLNWSVIPNGHAAGGRVILLVGSYSRNSGLQARLASEAKEAKNENIDLLHCVPPSDVASADGRRVSRLGTALRNAGHEVWGGGDPSTRLDFPRSVESFRVAQYESCRGLEG